MHADLILIILAALVVLAVVYRGRSSGDDLRRAWKRAQPADPKLRTCCTHPGTGICMCDCHDWLDDRDDDWSNQLHEINQLGKFGDLTRPVAHLTYYEVEALIRTLAVPEWLPDRYRMAA